MRFLFFIYLILYQSYLQASILSDELCQAYRGIFDQAFFSIVSAFSFAGILWSLAIDEGNKHFRTQILKVGIGILGLINIDQLVTIFTGQALIC